MVLSAQMYVEFVPKLAESCRQTIGQRANVEKTLVWVEQHPYAAVSLIDQFDNAITRFNQQRRVDVLPPFARNALSLREEYPSLLIPRLSKLIRAQSADRCQNAHRVLAGINIEMLRGETDQCEPYLAFHTEEIDPEARFIGALYHFYTALYLARPSSRDIGADKLVDALVEATDPRSPLMDALASPYRLDWIRDWSSFDPIFREQARSREYPPPPSDFPHEPYNRSDKRVCWPARIFQRVHALAYLQYSQDSGHSVGEELVRQRDWIRNQFKLWGGADNLNAWIGRYDPGHAKIPSRLLELVQ